ncbi:MAG TPA: Fic family protein [Acidimicrobiia bacterium]
MPFKTPNPDALEEAVMERIEDLRHRLRYAILGEPRRWTGRIRQHALARAIRGSNTIEGYDVSKNDALAAAEGEEPLEANEAAWTAVTSYRNAMTYVLQLADSPTFEHSEMLISSLHYMMLQYDLDKSPGRYRTGPIYVYDDELHENVYEGPEAEAVPALMKEFVETLQMSDAPVMVRAAMAHLNLVMIHPFRDGNGRMARGLQTLVLAREGIIAPQFSSIEEYLGRYSRDYYSILAEVGGGKWQPERDARPWVRFCLTAHFRQATTVLRRAKEAEKLWELLDAEVRRERLPERMVLALFDAALGYATRNATYRKAAELSSQVASRDLLTLCDAGLLEPHGEKRGRYYLATDRTRTLRKKAQEARPPLEDPFETTSPRQLKLVLPDQ